MKITAQEEYGLRCLLQLARASTGTGFTVKEIARLEGLSPAYVEKLLRLMGRASLTQSVRGIKGGYLLARKPQEISLGAVVRALGKVESTSEICGRFTGQRDTCIHIDNCCIRSAWATLTQKIEAFLNSITLTDLTGTESRARQVFSERMADQTRFPLTRLR